MKKLESNAHVDPTRSGSEPKPKAKPQEPLRWGQAWGSAPWASSRKAEPKAQPQPAPAEPEKVK